jgi:membrane-associated protease RseP (regulator of RpoE activity)
MEQSHWQLGTWRRVPVSMHWTVLLVFAWLYLFFWSLLATAIASAAFFSLLVAHELGHVAVLRARKISVERIELSGLHGKISHGWASAPDEILVAWGGVAAQLVVLLLAVVAGYLLDFQNPAVATIAGPILLVFTKLNVFLMILALLPIGPFDGHAAWAAIPWLRKTIRKRRQVARDIKLFPEKGLSPAKRRELEESSTKAASELMEKLAKKPEDRKEDA